MGMGISIVLIAAGAVLAFAVGDTAWNGFDMDVIGVILMVVGAVGLIASAIAMTVRRTSDHQVVERRDTHPRY